MPRPLSADSILSAMSSGILTDVIAVLLPTLKSASMGQKEMSPSSTIWKPKLLVAQVGLTLMPCSRSQ